LPSLFIARLGRNHSLVKRRANHAVTTPTLNYHAIAIERRAVQSEGNRLDSPAVQFVQKVPIVQTPSFILILGLLQIVIEETIVM